MGGGVGEGGKLGLGLGGQGVGEGGKFFHCLDFLSLFQTLALDFSRQAS